MSAKAILHRSDLYRSLNSHTSSLKHYRLRLERWKTSEDLWALTAADIRRIPDL